VFEDLERKFRAGTCETPLSFYFSLGREPIDKWTLLLGPEEYEFRNARPEGGKADCVLKTSRKIFTRIVVATSPRLP
jgi:long-chain acyl-CoA synthetase